MGIFDKNDKAQAIEEEVKNTAILYNTVIDSITVSIALKASKTYLDRMVYVHSRLGDKILATEFLRKVKTQEDMMSKLSIDRDTEHDELQLTIEECKVLLLGYFRLEIDTEDEIAILSDTGSGTKDIISSLKEDINKIRKEQQNIELFLIKNSN